MILSCQHIRYSYLVEPVLNDVSFHIDDGEQTAIVGVNGAGKTTLFNILTGELSPDEGQLFINNDISIGYLTQNARVDSDKSVYDEIYTADKKHLQMSAQLRQLENALAETNTPDNALIEEHHHLLEAYDKNDGFSYDSRVKGILNGLGFTSDQYTQSVQTLSGGQKTRLALGKLLLIQPDLLMLDEPTNHLDLNAIKWLEGFLNGYRGTLLMISHDRYFLDKLVHKVIDLEFGKAQVYKGNYTQFVDKKAFNQMVATRQYEAQQEEIKRQEEIIRKLRSYSQEKFIKRAQSREKVLEKMDVLDKPLELNENMKLDLHPRRESGNDVLRLRDLGMSFPDKPLFNHVDMDIYKEDKIALIGPNGIGKTTLFKLLMNELTPTNGTIKIGASVELAYYDQEHTALTETNNLIEEISDEFPTMEMSRIRNLLAAFLFTGDDVFKLVGDLSGGEKGRLSLAKLMLSKGNFLLLDEPTNHLDMVSKEVLENALNRYSGTILFISHDRYFINRVATKVIELTPDSANLYLGNYDYYMEKKAEIEDKTPVSTTTDTTTKTDWLKMKEESKRQKKQQATLEALELTIETLESEISAIDHQLTLEENFQDYTKSTALLSDKADKEAKLEEAMQKWESLAE